MPNVSAFRLGFLGLGIGVVSLSGAADAQLIGGGDTVSLSMTPTDRLAAKQVYPIAAGQFLKELGRQLTGAGIIVAPSQEAVRLIVDVTGYDSGPYLGFSKTARAAVAYRLEGPTGDAIAQWSDTCEGKAGVDGQDSPDRNRNAVALCLAALGTRLAERLRGPRAEVLVE